MGQAMANNANTQTVWRTRSALLIEDAGPSVLVAHGDGLVFALLGAEERPNLVKGIVALEPSEQVLQIQTQRLARLTGIPAAVVTPETSPPVLSALGNVTPIRLSERGIRVAGPGVMMRSSSEGLEPVLDWIQNTVTKGAPAVITSGVDPNRNRESTALRLADQGCFWVGVQRKQMSYGTIALGQMFVQYMIPVERRYPDAGHRTCRTSTSQFSASCPTTSSWTSPILAARARRFTAGSR